MTRLPLIFKSAPNLGALSLNRPDALRMSILLAVDEIATLLSLLVKLLNSAMLVFLDL